MAENEKPHIDFIGVGVMGHPLLLGSVAHQLYKMAHARGWDNLDDSILVRLMEEITNKQ